MDEEWRPIPTAEHLEVSNIGRVRRKSGERIRFVGQIKKTFPNKTRGYHLITWQQETGKTKAMYLHRAVALAFLPNPDNKPVVNHKNCIKTDNRVENLEWVTIRENYNHAINNKRYYKDMRGRLRSTGKLEGVTE